eukprot:490525-Amphidinium_carterae.1
MAGLDLPEAARGLIFLRDAGLSRQEADTMATWLQGDYAGDKVVGFLRNLDRLPGGTGLGKSLILAVEEEEYDVDGWSLPAGEVEDELWDAEDETYASTGEDVISEDLAQHILATSGGKGGYAQHRAHIQQHKLARGFPSVQSGRSTKGMDKGGSTKGKNRDRSIHALIARTRGQVGHWARTCTNPAVPPPAASSTSTGPGGKGQTMASGNTSTARGASSFTAFFLHGDPQRSEEMEMPATLSATHPDSTKSTDGEEVTDVYLHVPESLEQDGVFLAVLDTGAQSGVCGEKRWKTFLMELERKGLRPILTNLPAAGTRGIGGSAKGIGVFNTPVAVGGACGIMTIQVIQGDVPFLVSVAFQRAAKMMLDLSEERIEWKALYTESKVVSLPSGHLAVNILDCDVWQPPIYPVPINMAGALPNFALIAGVDGPSQASLGAHARELLDAGAESCTPSARRRPTACARTTSSSNTRSGRHNRMVAASDESLAAGDEDGRGHVQALGMAAEGNSEEFGHTVPAQTAGNTGCEPQQRRHYPLEGHWGSRLWQGALLVDGENQWGECGRVPASATADDRESKREAAVVHLQSVRAKMGESAIRGGHSACRSSDGIWPPCKCDVQGDSVVVQSMGSQADDGASHQGGGTVGAVRHVCNMVHEFAGSDERSGGSGDPSVDASGCADSDGTERARRDYDGRGGGPDFFGSESPLTAPWVTEIQPQLCHQLEEAVKALVGLSSNATQRGAQGMKSVVLGLYTTQGVGVTRASNHPTARKLLRLVHQAAKGLKQPYFAVTVNYIPEGAELPMHTDTNNWPGTMSFVCSFGQYQGGELWQRCDQTMQQWQSRETGSWIALDPTLPHGVKPVTAGVRWSLVVFTPGRLDQVPREAWQGLQMLGFPSRQRLAQRLCHRFSNGSWSLVQGTATGMPALDRSLLQSWGYTEVDQQCVLAGWTDQAASDGWGEQAADVRCLPKPDREAVWKGVQYIQQQLPGASAATKNHAENLEESAPQIMTVDQVKQIEPLAENLGENALQGMSAKSDVFQANNEYP